MGIPKSVFDGVVRHLYVIVVSLSLFFHVFNKVELFSGVKLFYIPALMSVPLSLYISKRKTKFFSLTIIFILVTFISALTVFSGAVISTFISFALVVLGTYGLRYVDLNQLLYVNKWLIPLVLIILLAEYWGELVYRFQGYYNDPNYLCTTLLVYLYILLSLIRKSKRMLSKIFYFAEVLLLLMLVFLTISRTGVLCVFLVVIVSLFHVIKKNPFISLGIITLFLLFSINTFISVFEEQTSIFQQRLEKGDNLSSASDLRKELSLQGVKYVMSEPFRLFLGIGIGETGNEEAIPNRKDFHRDHNTITSCLTEQGIIAFIFYALILWQIWIDLYREIEISNS